MISWVSGMLLIGLRFLAVWAWFLLSCILLLPVALATPRQPVANGLFSKIVCPVGLWILGIKLIVKNPEAVLRVQPCIYIFNHQHLLDVFLPISVVPAKTVTIVKSSLRWLPFFGWLAYLAGHLFIERSVRGKAIATMDTARDLILERGTCVLLSPEGTRSQGRGLLPFKKGAFHLALATRLPLLPLVISPYVAEIQPGRWRAGTITIQLLPPVPASDIDSNDLEGSIARVRKQMLVAIEGLRAKA